MINLENKKRDMNRFFTSSRSLSSMLSSLRFTTSGWKLLLLLLLVSNPRDAALLDISYLFIYLCVCVRIDVSFLDQTKNYRGVKFGTHHIGIAIKTTNLRAVFITFASHSISLLKHYWWHINLVWNIIIPNLGSLMRSVNFCVDSNSWQFITYLAKNAYKK